MADSIVLTDGARFQCAHMPAAVGGAEGISISLIASKITGGNSKPILNGAVISGFTAAAGCTFQVSGVSTPCVSFLLAAAPATGLLSENGQRVYIEADLAAIGLAVSTGNGQPGLTITESQKKLRA